MTLKEWLRTEERSGAWLARQMGVSRQTVSGWVSGAFAPGCGHLAKLEELTGGEVGAADFVVESPAANMADAPEQAG